MMHSCWVKHYLRMLPIFLSFFIKKHFSLAHIYILPPTTSQGFLLVKGLFVKWKTYIKQKLFDGLQCCTCLCECYMTTLCEDLIVAGVLNTKYFSLRLPLSVLQTSTMMRRCLRCGLVGCCCCYCCCCCCCGMSLAGGWARVIYNNFLAIKYLPKSDYWSKCLLSIKLCKWTLMFSNC